MSDVRTGLPVARKRDLQVSDVLPVAEYGKIRAAKRREIAEHKRHRRVEVGPFITFYFESYETMWTQVHEMLFIEKAPPEQAVEEIAAYGPLIPKGQELVATFMIEINEPAHRKRMLDRLGGIENTAFLEIAGVRVDGVAEADQDRTTADGKASAVQFVQFPFSAEEIAAFRTPNARVVLGLAHTNYGHMAVMPETVRAALAEDFA
jgi:Protein of unknown function (DUF3501)